MPHGMLVRGRQAGVGDRVAAGRPHDALRQQKIAEEGCHQQVLQAKCMPCQNKGSLNLDGCFSMTCINSLF
jgi:hypothetical protein